MIQRIYNKIKQHQRLSSEEALVLAVDADFLTLGQLAQQIAKEKNGTRAAFLIDRNINYTNICTARCSFCAFYRPLNHKQGYDLSFEEIDQKIEETLSLGGHRILMQGGLHPDHTIETYETLIRHIRKNHAVHIHAFSPPEIHYVADKAGISIMETLERLKDAGLNSMPGGGAEILVDKIRNQISSEKCQTDEWLSVMETAHNLGIRTTATMMIGHIESWEDRIEHLDKLRTLQDQTQGFLSFIPWTYQPESTSLYSPGKERSKVNLVGAYEYVRLLAVSRIFLDNFDHIQVSLLTQGTKVAQLGLFFGADDVGSLLLEENVVRLAGCPQEVGLHKEKMVKLIEEAGLEAFERDTYYGPTSKDC